MLDIRVSQMKRIVLFEVNGRIDSLNASEFGAPLMKSIDEGSYGLVVDLAQVSYMSSAGLRELVSAFRAARRKGGDLVLVQPSERVLEILDMVGLLSIFEVFPDSATASQVLSDRN